MKIVVMTGASRGLGRAIHEQLAEAGATVVSIGRSPPPTPDAVHVDCDLLSLGTADGWTRLSRALADGLPGESGELVFVNCAGTIQPIGGLDEVDPDAIIDAITVNLTAPLAIARALLTRAEASGAGLKIVNVTSGAAQRPVGGWIAYCAGKAGAHIAFDALAQTHPERVGVHHIDPGALEGEMQAQIRAAEGRFPARDMFIRWQAEGALRPPSEAAARIVATILGDA